jgi:hypothetical protein
MAIVAPKIAISAIPTVHRPGFPLNFRINHLWIFSNITEEDVAPGIFRLAIMSVSIDGNPVVALPVLVRSVAIPHVMTMMHMFVKRLRIPKSHRLHDAKQPVNNSGSKVWIMNVVV